MVALAVDPGDAGPPHGLTMVIRRWNGTLPQAKLSGARGTAQRPKAGRRASFGGNAGTGGRK